MYGLQEKGKQLQPIHFYQLIEAHLQRILQFSIMCAIAKTRA